MTRRVVLQLGLGLGTYNLNPDGLDIFIFLFSPAPSDNKNQKFILPKLSTPADKTFKNIDDVNIVGPRTIKSVRSCWKLIHLFLVIDCPKSHGITSGEHAFVKNVAFQSISLCHCPVVTKSETVSILSLFLHLHRRFLSFHTRLL
jgi:hypothetical protein